MPLRNNDSTILRVSRSTHEALANAAERRGMKLYALTDRALNDFLKRDGGLE